MYSDEQVKKETARVYRKAWYEANKEKISAYSKARYEANRERLKAQSKAYREANPEKDKARKKAYREANREKIKAYSKAYDKTRCKKSKARWKAYRIANPDKIRGYRKTYAKANPEKIRERCRKRRALKYKTQIEMINEKEVYLRDGWICQICHKKVDKRLRHPNPMSPSMDHIVPLYEGGSHTYKNVQLAHFGCNSGKKDGILPQGEQLRIF